MAVITTFEDPWYYLKNFHFVLDWVAQRYGDLLIPAESEFITSFGDLPENSRGLLVRMVMRKGELFRASKLRYTEIGSPSAAAKPLVERGWLSQNPVLSLDELFCLLNKKELSDIFGRQLADTGGTTARKAMQLELLRPLFAASQAFSAWTDGNTPLSTDTVYRENISLLSDRFRLMFFGNLRQDWSELVLRDAGIYTYEKVEFSPSSRAFHTREDVNAYLDLQCCKEQMLDAILMNKPAKIDAMQEAIPARFDNPWLEARRGKLLFQIGQHHEREQNWPQALDCYKASPHTGARSRRIRVLERSGQYQAAIELARSALLAPENEAEHQTLLRMMPRLLRQVDGVKIARRRRCSVPETRLTLPTPQTWLSVEEEVRLFIEKPDAPAFYVENTLMNSLFGLLFWEAIFAAIPGAFFHPFQQAPSDLLSANFYASRRPQFDAGFRQLDSGQYKETILRNFELKAGLQCSFVAWGLLTKELLTMALACIPASHLFIAFDRLRKDFRENRSGLPDLIQFWPEDQRYKMIEVKGPGDRLQDNQVRWLDYCHAHHMPVGVCYVQRPSIAEP
ncbi:VRR-NUC domain-containing protein [Candidimonas sp. SYP-B2681]|uniref:VRR-NUC domain-containing protein n=1 Tax=Candidimonas sp. SYP-B2681 TaxID=2497686 RepID=UPI000F860C7E|nr:VRR-NUC domain-containing protein [Candidimonas sp. SYP-B2681]RTZ47650.1 VRR-NUC domain-containing protein [Candidimonas sp. SYP-B2681]